MSAELKQLADWVRSAESVVVFTGAGVSTESGIPDFRSPGGVWSESQPVYFDEFLRSPEARHEYWRQKSVSHREFANAQPNTAHRVLAEWEHRGRIRGVITQNIDGLHQQAGSQCVLELHGTAREVSCLTCSRCWPADPWVERFLKEEIPPNCPDCGGFLKHATVSFGQVLPEDVLMEAADWAASADLFIALGSSLVVYPAAGLPVAAVQNGGRLVIVNRTETPLDDAAALIFRGELGATLAEVEAILTGE